MYLLDTNIASELRRLRPHGAVLGWLKSVPGDSIFMPAIAAGEIQVAIERTRKTDAEKAMQLSQWLDALLATSQWLPAGPEIFRIWGHIAAKNPDHIADALIAATALHHNMIVVTRNIRNFQLFDAKVLNPFDFAS